MNKELKQKWIDALRSGKYTQGRGVLRSRTNSFCCLGVLLDISGKGEWKGDGDSTYDFVVKDAFFDEEWPHWSTISTELEAAGRRITGLSQEQESRLIELNDRVGASFSQIAEWVESHT